MHVRSGRSRSVRWRRVVVYQVDLGVIEVLSRLLRSSYSRTLYVSRKKASCPLVLIQCIYSVQKHCGVTESLLLRLP